MISVLTPTGARPEAFAACAEMMRAQDYPWLVRWVIVDDGPEQQEIPEMPGNWYLWVVRPEPLWKPGQNTQARNILAGLEYCPDRVVIVEDDDRYADWWLSFCDEKLNEHDLIGESHSLYRNVKSGTVKEMGNDKHASLCSTALKGEAVDALRAVCETGQKAIDIRLWRQFGGSKKLYKPEPRGVTGIKGLPGRPGIGAGHKL